MIVWWMATTQQFVLVAPRDNDILRATTPTITCKSVMRYDGCLPQQFVQVTPRDSDILRATTPTFTCTPRLWTQHPPCPKASLTWMPFSPSSPTPHEWPAPQPPSKNPQTLVYANTWKIGVWALAYFRTSLKVTESGCISICAFSNSGCMSICAFSNTASGYLRVCPLCVWVDTRAVLHS